MASYSLNERNAKGQFVSKYRPEMCDRLIQYMAGGFSFAGACGKLGISFVHGYEWAKKKPEWKAAKEQGEAARLAYLENLALHAALSLVPVGSDGAPISNNRLHPSMIMFLLKTGFSQFYSEKVFIEKSDGAGDFGEKDIESKIKGYLTTNKKLLSKDPGKTRDKTAKNKVKE